MIEVEGSEIHFLTRSKGEKNAAATATAAATEAAAKARAKAVKVKTMNERNGKAKQKQKKEEAKWSRGGEIVATVKKRLGRMSVCVSVCVLLMGIWSCWPAALLCF